MNKTKLIAYSSPVVETLKIEVEGAFSASDSSYLDYKPNPSMDYGDEGEEWF